VLASSIGGTSPQGHFRRERDEFRNVTVQDLTLIQDVLGVGGGRLEWRVCDVRPGLWSVPSSPSLDE
jgi:hypothetical protein